MTTDDWGIHHEYEDAFRKRRAPPQSTLDAIRHAMSADAGTRPGEARTILVRPGDRVHVGPAEMALEDGTSLAIFDILPPDLPLGYHELRRESQEPVRLIVSPGACRLPGKRRDWTWAVQLYAARSNGSWGIGDLADLAKLARWSKELGAGMILINPLHAAATGLPQEPSPYFPTSREFRNPIYLSIEEIPEAKSARIDLAQLASAGRALNNNRRIDRDEVYRLKRQALLLIYERFAGDDQFDAYVAKMGESLSEFATFCALAYEHGRDYRQWPNEFRHPASAAVGAFRRQSASKVRFYSWLQWLVDRQLAAAAGEISIVQDLAVGFDPGGADAWMWQDLLARDMSVGAPPDLHNPWGQDWGVPPFDPHKLAQAGYEPFIQTIRGALAHAGGLRIDHAMGMFRLFWIPRGASPDAGTYVNYPARALLDIVALESHRAGAFVVAEDLGTVEKYMREELMRHQMLSYRLLWLEEERPSTYPERSMAAVTTHDLYTIAGLWTGSDFRSQQQIGLAPHHESVDEVTSRIQSMTGLTADAPLPEVVTKVHKLLAEASSMIVAATLDDALLVEERPNMPGTTVQWPNWRIALPAAIEELQQRPLPRQIADILNHRAEPRSGRGD
jgi:4-alpha-glucanotransferase